MDGVYFFPWVGKFYEKGGCFNKRVMILGDSHYCDRDEPCIKECGVIKCKKDPYTTKVITEFLSGYRDTSTKSFTGFERAVFNKELSQEETEYFWNSVIFYNYIQKAMPEPGIAPEKELYEEAFKPFKEVMEEYKPDIIIAWGIMEGRLFKSLPEDNGKDAESIEIDNKIRKGWIYYLKNDQEVKVYGINHPSIGFEREKWHKIIQWMFGVNNVTASLK